MAMRWPCWVAWATLIAGCALAPPQPGTGCTPAPGNPGLEAAMRRRTDRESSAGPHPVTRTWFAVDAEGSLSVYKP